jgi:hypothetical protein
VYDPPLRFYGFRRGGIILTVVFVCIDSAIFLICVYAWMIWWVLVYPIIMLIAWMVGRRRGRRLVREAALRPKVPPRPTRPPHTPALGPDGLPTHPVHSDQWRGYSRDLLDD